MSGLFRFSTAWRANFDGQGVAPGAPMAETESATRAISGEGSATMTAFWARAAFAAVGVLALQACTIPHSQYPPSADYHTPAALQPAAPQYPVRQDQPPPIRSADPHDPVASPTPPVDAAPLPPAGASAPPSADFGPRPTYAVYMTAGPLPLWPAARHVRARAHERAARGRREAHAAPTVRVRKGETLRQLARRYGTTPRALAKANRIHHPTDLAVGEVLRVPGVSLDDQTPRERRAERAEAAREARSPKTYRARPGDTIYAIGRRFKVSPMQIEALNGFTQKTHLKTGQVVRLPGAPGEEIAVRETREPAPRPEAAPREPLALGASRRADTLGATEPDHPIPYAELQGGRLVGPSAPIAPPERPIVPPVAQPPPVAAAPTSDVLSAGRGRFIWPVRGSVLAGFGPKPGGQRSDGLDIGAPDGAPVVAAATGEVVYSGSLPQLGNLVLIKHDDGWITAYAHLSKTEVRIKDHVTQGQEVGQAGRSGNAAQSEVYFEIRYAPTPRDKAKPVDPALLLAAQ